MPNDTGTITFQVCTTSNCSSPIGSTFDSSVTTNGADGSAQIPGGLLGSDGTYYWRAKSTDSTPASSAYSATRSFVVDTTAPTVVSATVAADGLTVTVTWSENLDSLQAVTGDAFSVNAITGTGNVSYPAANKTRFTLATAVNHLDTLTLDYTKPGSGPAIADKATPTGNEADDDSLANGSITNNTDNIAPSTPSLVAPANGTQRNTATPTLSATFGDPDPNDTGTITFQVCTTSNCSSPIGSTFDSSVTANGADGSAQIPGGLLAADGTYYWRAKSTDSTPASSAYSATRSFVVDTTTPTSSRPRSPPTASR